MIAFCGLLLKIEYGQTTSATIVQLEALEQFTKRPTARVIWSKEMSRIDIDRAHAVITALTVEDPGQTPRKMRGVRIDLTEGNVKDQVYARDDLLQRLIDALDDISNGASAFLSRPSRSPNSRSCFGSGTFWQQIGHAFSASQCVSPDWSGLSVSTGTAGFHFTGLSSSPFAAAIVRARDELKQQ